MTTIRQTGTVAAIYLTTERPTGVVVKGEDGERRTYPWPGPVPATGDTVVTVLHHGDDDPEVAHHYRRGALSAAFCAATLPIVLVILLTDPVAALGPLGTLLVSLGLAAQAAVFTWALNTGRPERSPATPRDSS